MKKFFMFIAACALAVYVQAQVVVVENGNNRPTTDTGAEISKSENEQVKGRDYYLNYNSDIKLGSFSFGCDMGKNGYLKAGFGATYNDLNEHIEAILGFGAKKRYTIDDFLIQCMIYPYIGIYRATIDKSDPDHTYDREVKFTYGAAANLSVGLRLCETKKGNSTFITLGYYIAAPELETKNMLKNGSWGIGITTILK